MELFTNREVEINEIFLPVIKEQKVQLFLQRDDLLHPNVSGNKWRKLKYGLGNFDRNKYKGVLSFGGAFSNHLTATSAACKILGIPFVAVIRGEKPDIFNASLKMLEENGDVLIWISRSRFKELRQKKWPNPFEDKFNDFLIIPEGGSGKLAIKACEDISDTWNGNYDFACCSIGTGTTFSGMVRGLDNDTIAMGFVMLKDQNYLNEDIKNLIEPSKNEYYLDRNYHFGGFGKTSDELIQFMNEFYEQTKIKLDPIYTGKLIFGLIDKIKKGDFPMGSKIIAIHTGGIQGIDGFNEMQTKKNKPCLNYSAKKRDK